MLIDNRRTDTVYEAKDFIFILIGRRRLNISIDKSVTTSLQIKTDFKQHDPTSKVIVCAAILLFLIYSKKSVSGGGGAQW